MTIPLITDLGEFDLPSDLRIRRAFLGGSRGMGLHHEESDYDLVILTHSLVTAQWVLAGHFEDCSADAADEYDSDEYQFVCRRRRPDMDLNLMVTDDPEYFLMLHQMTIRAKKEGWDKETRYAKFERAKEIFQQTKDELPL